MYSVQTALYISRPLGITAKAVPYEVEAFVSANVFFSFSFTRGSFSPRIQPHFPQSPCSLEIVMLAPCRMDAQSPFRNSKALGERRARTATSTVSEFLHAGAENEVHHFIEDGRGWARAWAMAGFYVL